MSDLRSKILSVLNDYGYFLHEEALGRLIAAISADAGEGQEIAGYELVVDGAYSGFFKNEAYAKESGIESEKLFDILPLCRVQRPAPDVAQLQARIAELERQQGGLVEALKIIRGAQQAAASFRDLQRTAHAALVATVKQPATEGEQMSTDKYEAPFKFVCGYIYDAKNRIVADDDGQDVALRIRGWGRIGYLPDAAKLQDTVGELIAEALTQYWEANSHD